MAKKKNENSNNNNNEKENSGGKKQKASSVSVVVLKMDLHCEGCAGRVVKAVRTLDGVESVRIGDSELNKLTVIGNLDPAILRKKVEEKTKKKVEVISPATKKNNDSDKNNRSDGDGDGGVGGGPDNKKEKKKPPQKDEQPPSEKSKTALKKEEKKPKELPVITAVLKVPLHCQGCVRKIHKVVSKAKGYMEMSIDKNRDLVTVKGAIDMKLLAEVLKQKLKRAVEIVPAKKDGGGDGGGEKKGKGGGEKKGKGGGGGNDGEEKGGGGSEKKGKKGGGGGGGDDGDGNDGFGGKAEAFKMENFGGAIGYPYPHFAYGSGYADYVHAPQLFSDENPNACSVM